jgi:hypothetical protein
MPLEIATPQRYFIDRLRAVKYLSSLGLAKYFPAPPWEGESIKYLCGVTASDSQLE